MFIVVGVPIAVAARLAGLDPEMVRLAAWVVASSLWFLAVYLVVVALTPAMLAAHRRWGLAVPAALTVVAAGFDALRLRAGVGYLGVANFLVVWLILPQLGFAWRDGTLTRTPARPWLLFLGGSVALVALTTVGPYPISMVGVPGAEVQNTSPPTVALLALAVAHTGLVLLLAGPLRRWLVRRRVWMAVIAVNGVIMTLYLWHMVPVLVVALALYPTGVMPQPEIGSASWFAWRPVWVVACGLLLGSWWRCSHASNARPAGHRRPPFPTPGRSPRLNGVRRGRPSSWCWSAPPRPALGSSSSPSAASRAQDPRVSPWRP